MKTVILKLDKNYTGRLDVLDGTICKVYLEFNTDEQVYEIALVYD